jgi:hypothetical protein
MNKISLPDSIDVKIKATHFELNIQRRLLKMESNLGYLHLKNLN